MKESSTYQWILQEGLQEGRQKGREEGLVEGREEGAVFEARKLLQLLGEAAFGAADKRTLAAINKIDDLPRLEELLMRVRTASNWGELLAKSTTGNGHDK